MAEHEDSSKTVLPHTGCHNAIMKLAARTTILSFHGGDIVPAKTIPLLEKLTEMGIQKITSYSCRLN